MLGCALYADGGRGAAVGEGLITKKKKVRGETIGW